MGQAERTWHMKEMAFHACEVLITLTGTDSTNVSKQRAVVCWVTGQDFIIINMATDIHNCLSLPPLLYGGTSVGILKMWARAGAIVHMVYRVRVYESAQLCAVVYRVRVYESAQLCAVVYRVRVYESAQLCAVVYRVRVYESAQLCAVVYRVRVYESAQLCAVVYRVRVHERVQWFTECGSMNLHSRVQ